MERNYLIIDLGTGNTRAAIVSSKGTIHGIKSFENRYYTEKGYEDARYFLPEEWKEKIYAACRELLAEHPDRSISAITSSGARESIVLYDREGTAFYGLPNIDNRGRAFMASVPHKEEIYRKTGRWVTEDFPAGKLLGLSKVQPELFGRTASFTSLSEWIAELFTGVICIEPSQACETQLFDMEIMDWSETICGYFGLESLELPKLIKSGGLAGGVKEEAAKQLGISQGIPFLTGGADTQVALKGAGVKPGDVAVVSGTTSPVVTLVPDKFYDKEERCWTDCNLGGGNYLVETNPGVTGLNYQALKSMMFADMTYEKLDEILQKKEHYRCTASFSSLLFSQKRSLKKGGFLMKAPLDLECDRTDLAWALLADIACSIYVQYQSLCGMVPNHSSCIIGCGGGFQSEALCQMLADLTGKELVIREGFSQATLSGCAEICNDYFETEGRQQEKAEEVFKPRKNALVKMYLEEWKQNREILNPEQK